ncbi:hypothetical protein [Flavobacterium aquidurense]|uniref:hypothetical protein n=1 Tax=Flavobacterium aquidurense TaxID=362413 RepID=UPI00285F476A|nr:hypothetical protein [Flavobacterium aquidurense]MDR7371535.1 4-hydroxybenzoate polyprenyltransferase [Flavobacterium aquidurense]
MKEYTRPINIAIFFWGLLLLIISNFYPDYARYYLYLSIIVIIPVAIFNLIKQRKQDKINDTTVFQSSIYRMLIMAVLLAAFFFLTKQNPV